jgi:hypothetical protein
MAGQRESYYLLRMSAADKRRTFGRTIGGLLETWSSYLAAGRHSRGWETVSVTAVRWLRADSWGGGASDSARRRGPKVDARLDRESPRTLPKTRWEGGPTVPEGESQTAREGTAREGTAREGAAGSPLAGGSDVQSVPDTGTRTVLRTLATANFYPHLLQGSSGRSLGRDRCNVGARPKAAVGWLLAHGSRVKRPWQHCRPLEREVPFHSLTRTHPPMSSPLNPALRDFHSSLDQQLSTESVPSPYELTFERDTPSPVPPPDAVDRRIPDSTTTSHNLTTSSSLQSLRSPSPNLTRPLLQTSQSDARPTARSLRRNSRTFPSLLSRISSAAAGGAAIAVSPSRSFRRQSSRESVQHSSHRSVDHRPRDLPGNRDSRSAQAVQNSQSVPPSHSTTSASVRQSGDAGINRVAGKRHLLARTGSRDFFTAPMPMTSQGQPAGQADKEKKMHQTSSRLLRMTDDDRPFTRVSASAKRFVFSCRFHRPRAA